MKGMVFTELLTMAESVMGEEAVDQILDDLDLDSGAAYNAVGNYPCSELFTLVGAFGAYLDMPLDQLQRKFGVWMFDYFAKNYPVFFDGKADALAMLDAIENEVHVEVRKLYPNVELPSFETTRLGENGLRMIYHSERPLIDFCHGLIEACVEHFGEPAEIDRQDRSEQGRYVAEFRVRKVA